MNCLRIGTLILTILGVGAACPAETGGPWELVSQHRDQELVRVKVALEARGKLTSDEDQAPVPMSVTAQSVFYERYYDTLAQGALALRKYEHGRTRIQVGDSAEETSLPASKRWIVASASEGPHPAVTLHAAKPHLSRRELDAIELPGDNLALERLLPDEPVAEGDSWTPAAEALAAVLQLDEATDCAVRCRLSEVRNGLAMIVFAGNVVGRVTGAATGLEVSGEIRFDVQRQLIRWCQLKWKEDRNASSTGPAVQAVAEIRILREPEALSENREWPASISRPNERDLLLEFTSRHAGFRFLHERDWVVVEDDDRKTTLRLVHNGNVRAQCHWSRLDDQPPGKQLSLEAFQDDIRQALKDQFVEFESAKQFVRDDGVTALRVAALGTVEKGPVRWLYCHLQDPSGKRVSFVGVMDQRSEEQAREIDRILLGTLQFLPGSDRPAPEQPVQQAKRSQGRR